MTLTLVSSRTDATDAERLAAAQLAVVEGYAGAVYLLGAAPPVPAHERLGWYVEGLADAREIAGLPRATMVPASPPSRDGEAAKAAAFALRRIAAGLHQSSRMRDDLLEVAQSYIAEARLRGVTIGGRALIGATE